MTNLYNSLTHHGKPYRTITLCLLLVVAAIAAALTAPLRADEDPAAAIAEMPIHAEIAPDEIISVSVDGTGPFVLVYDAQGGETVVITARSTGGDDDYDEDSAEYRASLDPVLDVLGRDGYRLAYNHRHGTARDDLGANDALINGLRLDDAGPYYIRANTYGGNFRAEIDVLLEIIDPFDTAVTENDDGDIIVTGRLPRFETFTYTFDAQTDELFTITARDTSRRLDPLLTLLDPGGVEMASNDDHGSADSSLDVRDSRISDVVAPVDGMYTVTLTDFIGNAGRFELTITRR